MRTHRKKHPGSSIRRSTFFTATMCERARAREHTHRTETDMRRRKEKKMSLFLFLWLCCWCELFRMLFDKENDKRGRPAWPTVSHHCHLGWLVPVSPERVGELIDSVASRSSRTTLHELIDERSAETSFHIEWHSSNKRPCYDINTCRQICVCVFISFSLSVSACWQTHPEIDQHARMHATRRIGNRA